MATAAQGQSVVDTTAAMVDSAAMADTVVVHKKDSASHQLTLGIDIVGPIENAFIDAHKGYEIAASYYLHNEIYLAGEGGWGSSTVNYTDLKYSTTNTFYRLGLDRMVFPRQDVKDWGGMIIGARLAMANIKRSPATYTVIDSLWGNGSGAIGEKTLNSYWFELTGGVRVEVTKGLLVGWNVRGKFLLNAKQLQDLAPLYIAGYGRGDKNTAFDINFYISYAIRWKKKSLMAPVKVDAKSDLVSPAK